MLKIEYKKYLDKVYGCFLGKALIGNIGAPYEGMKQYLDFEYSEEFFKEMIPNDDLDLQVLWLEVLEKKGKYFTSKDLADIFHEKCPYAPGEYAMFKKNYEKGIYPPYSGSFGASIFENGMGSPIRSEIWACIAPNNPTLAAKYAKMDSCLDHKQGSDSENGEVFFAVMESLAFSKEMSDCDVSSFALKIINEAAEYIPQDSKLKKLIDDTLYWYSQSNNFEYTRGMIIRFYGDVEATICYENIGFIILSMLSGKMDFITCGMHALSCGFDTDCTCATIGALLGIIYGAEEIAKRYNLTTATYKLGVNTTRRSDSIKDLSEDIAAVGYYFAQVENKSVQIENYTGKLLNIKKPTDKISFSVEYVGEPTISIGEKKSAFLYFKNLTEETLMVSASFTPLTDMIVSFDKIAGEICPKGEYVCELFVKVPEKTQYLPASNKIMVDVIANGEKYTFDFGYSGAKQWQIAGPFWHNIVDVPKLKIGESYWGHVSGVQRDNMRSIDLIRHYHTNCLPDCYNLTPEYVFDKPHKNDARFIANYVNTAHSDFILEDYEKFNGQANYYLKTIVFSPEEKKVDLQIGFSDTCKVWLNGELIAENKGSNKFNYENLHFDNITLKKGDNQLVVMLTKIGAITQFSYDFVKDSACSDHITELSTKNLKI